MNQKYYQPKELAKICGVKLSTLNGYLRDTEMFPPAKVDKENGYRYYNDVTVKDIDLFKKLKKKPFNLKISAVKIVLTKLDIQSRNYLLEKSNAEIFSHLEQNNLW